MNTSSKVVSGNPFDTVTIPLDRTGECNILTETMKMDYADPTDCIDTITELGLTGPQGQWTAAGSHPPATVGQDVVSYSIRRNGGQVAYATIHLQTGEVKAHPAEALQGVKMTIKITRVNRNRQVRGAPLISS